MRTTMPKKLLSRRHRPTAAWLLFTLAWVGPGLPMSTAATCPSVRQHGAWTTIDVPNLSPVGTLHGGIPRFTAGGSRTRLYAYGGDSVWRSTDGGCSWNNVYSIDPQAPGTNPTEDPAAAFARANPFFEVEELSVPARKASAAAQQDVVYALVGDSGGADAGDREVGTPMFVARSLDSGSSWRTLPIMATLPGSTQPTPVLEATVRHDAAIYPSSDDPRVAYLVLSAPVLNRGSTAKDPVATATETGSQGTQQDLLVTRDAGATWSYSTLVNANPDGDGNTRDAVLALDPSSAGVLWRGAANLLEVSLNFGATWKAVKTLPSAQTITGIDVWHPAGKSPQLLLTAGPTQATAQATPQDPAPSQYFYRSPDGGKTFVQLPPPVSGNFPYEVVGGQGWLVASDGEAIVIANLNPHGASTPVLFRRGTKPAWLGPFPVRPHLSPSGKPSPDGSQSISQLEPMDLAHRYYFGYSVKLYVLVVFDAAAR
jgi:hypothetical protein